jgi:hypothetical protein
MLISIFRRVSHAHRLGIVPFPLQNHEPEHKHDFTTPKALSNADQCAGQIAGRGEFPRQD